MARRVDAERKRLRNQVIDLLALAHNQAMTMSDKCADLRGQSMALVGDTPLGTKMVEDMSRSQTLLGEALSAIGAASTETRAIDVTVEVPDDTK